MSLLAIFAGGAFSKTFLVREFTLFITALSVFVFLPESWGALLGSPETRVLPLSTTWHSTQVAVDLV